MGKRKRTGISPTAYHPSPSDSMPCSSGRDLGERYSSDPDEITILKSRPSGKEIMDNHGKQSNSQLSLNKHHQNLSRSMFLKRSRHHYGNQYSRRNSSNYHKPSTSHGKGSGSPFNDERLCFKLGGKHNADLGHRPDFTEFRERALWRPERIRSSSVIRAVSPEGARMACGICQKSLKRKPHHFGSAPSPEELSIVAVLVCGHLFHADCLESKTRLEDKRDPPCPTCSGFVPKAEAT